jgi:hypothetical protein
MKFWIKRSGSTESTSGLSKIYSASTVLYPSEPYAPFQRHTLIPGFAQDRLSRATIAVVGLGAVSPVVRWGVRKGWAAWGRLRLFDPDVTSITNWPRQEQTREEATASSSPYKVHALAKRLLHESAGPIVVEAHAMTLKQAIAAGIDPRCDVAIILVDNDPGRMHAVITYLDLGVPAIFAGFSPDAQRGYVFVQEPAAASSAPCLACVFPFMVGSQMHYPCSGQTADLPLLLGGLILYAVDTVLGMERYRDWNYREIGLGTGLLDRSRMLPQRSGCPICKGKQR